MYQLEFAWAYDYTGEDENIVIPVMLCSGANEVPVGQLWIREPHSVSSGERRLPRLSVSI